MGEHLIDSAESALGLRIAQGRRKHLIRRRIVTGPQGIKKPTGENVVLFRNKFLDPFLLIASCEQ
jgi:hypothetical protein